jgi:ankyrin repeat protein
MNLMEAIQADDVDAVRAALSDDPASAGRAGDDGVSPVRAALYRHKQELADAVLEADPELDVFDAAALGRTDRLTELLDGDPDRATGFSGDGFTALQLASYFGQAEAVRVLLDHGADVSAASTNAMKIQALHAAVAAHSQAAVAALLVAGADPNARQEGDWTPLMAAEQHGDTEIVRLLMDHGAAEHPEPEGVDRPPDRPEPSGSDATGDA